MNMIVWWRVHEINGSCKFYITDYYYDFKLYLWWLGFLKFSLTAIFYV